LAVENGFQAGKIRPLQKNQIKVKRHLSIWDFKTGSYKAYEIFSFIILNVSFLFIRLSWWKEREKDFGN